MTHSTSRDKVRPSPWAVGLFVISSGFALVALVLVSTGYIPV